MRVHAPSSKSTVRSIPVLQILATQSSVRCLCWSSRNSILGIGMSPAVGFYRLSAQEVTAHRRARHRQVTIGTTSAPLSPVWLHEPASNRHVGSYKLAKVRAQEELKHVSDPGVSQVCSLEWCRCSFLCLTAHRSQWHQQVNISSTSAHKPGVAARAREQLACGLLQTGQS
jgi:hypothetical protein